MKKRKRKQELRLEEPQIQCSQWNVSNSSHPSESHWTRRVAWVWGNRTREDIEKAVKKRKILSPQNGPCRPWRIPNKVGECRGGWEDLKIRLSRKYNEFNLAEAFDPRRTDNTTTTKPSGIARPTSIDSALFLCPVILDKNWILSRYGLPPSLAFVHRLF